MDLATLTIGLVGSCMTQVAPPPPPPPPPTPEYVRPERPQSPLRRDNPNEIDPGAQMNIPFESLAVTDEEGRIIRLQEPMEFAALRNNLTVQGAVTQKRIEASLIRRRVKFENIVIRDLDLVLKIDDGALDNISLDDIDKLKDVVSLIRPLIEPGPLTKHLKDEGAITATQARQNQQIAKDYQDKVINELREVSDDTMGPLMGFMMEEAVKEPIAAFEGLLLDATDHIDEILDEIEVSSATRDAIAKQLGELETNEDSTRAIELSKQILMALPDIDSQRAYLKAAQDKRPSIEEELARLKAEAEAAMKAPSVREGDKASFTEGQNQRNQNTEEDDG